MPEIQPASERTLPYSPRAPKFAKLETGEVHHYTFTVYPFIYKNGSFIPPQLPGWYPDATHSTWHLTDVRILVEADETTTAEDLIAKACLSVLNMNLGAKVGAMGVTRIIESGQQRMKDMIGQCLTIP